MDHFFVIKNLTTGWFYVSDGTYSERILLAEGFMSYESAQIKISELPKGFYEIIKVYE